MEKFNNVVQKYLKNHERHKKYFAVLLSLSLVIAFIVPLGLIENANSLTLEEPIAEQLLMARTDAPGGAYDMQGNISMKASYFDQDNLTVNGESATVKFHMEFSVTKNQITSTGADNRTMYYQITDPHIKPNETITNEDFYDGSTLAGTYSITDDGLITMTFNETYWTSHTDNNEYMNGFLNFYATISRDEDENGNVDVSIGGVNLTVPFEQRKPNISKSNQVDKTNKEITWTITVRNPRTGNGNTLDGAIITDDMLNGVTSITADPPGSAVLENGQIKLSSGDASKNEEIKITYQTSYAYASEVGGTISETAGGMISNTATLTSVPGIPNEEIKSNESIANIPAVMDVVKTGEPDYSQSKIKWTIEVVNLNKTPMTDHIIIDDAINGAALTFSTENGGVPSSVTVEGNEIRLNGYNGDGFTVSYYTNLGESTTESESWITDRAVQVWNETNHWKWMAGGDTKKEGDVQCQFKPIKDFSKSGGAKKSDRQVEWTITIERTNSSVPFTDFEITDRMLSQAVGAIIIRDGNNSNNQCGTTFTSSDVVGDTLTLTGDIESWANDNSLNKIQLVYRTNVDANTQFVYINGNNYIQNKADLGKDGHGYGNATGSAMYNTEVKIDKSVSPSNYSGFEASKQTLTWTVTLTDDNGFESKNVTDTLSPGLDEDGTIYPHTFAKNPEFTVKYKNSSNQWMILDESAYELELGETSYTLRFTENVSAGDVTNLNQIQISYKTVADAISIEPGKTAKFGNSAEYSEKPGSSIKKEFEYERKDNSKVPYEKYAISDLDEKLPSRADENKVTEFTLSDLKSDGDYYVFNWAVEYKQEDLVSTNGKYMFKDTLPVGFEFVKAYAYIMWSASGGTDATLEGDGALKAESNWESTYKITGSKESGQQVTFYLNSKDTFGCPVKVIYSAKISKNDLESFKDADGSYKFENSIVNVDENENAVYAPAISITAVVPGEDVPEDMGLLEKTFNKNSSNFGNAAYQVIFNPDGKHLGAGADSGMLKLSDKLSVTNFTHSADDLKPLLKSVTVYEYDAETNQKKQLSANNYSYEPNTDNIEWVPVNVTTQDYEYNYNEGRYWAVKFGLSDGSNILAGDKVTVTLTKKDETPLDPNDPDRLYVQTIKILNTSIGDVKFDSNGKFEYSVVSSSQQYTGLVEFDAGYSGYPWKNYTNCIDVEVKVERTQETFKSGFDIYVPDDTPVLIEYTYYFPNTGNWTEADKVTLSNAIEWEDQSARSDGNEIDFKKQSSDAGIKSVEYPLVEKVAKGNYSVRLSAKFILAKYQNGVWSYATAIPEKEISKTQGNYHDAADNTKTTWKNLTGNVSNSKDLYTALTGVTDAEKVAIDTKDYYINLNSNVLYAFIETTTPSEYLTPDAPYYFAYEQTPQNMPNYVTSENRNVHIALSGGKISIENSRNIDITVEKEWGGTVGDSVQVALYRSTTKPKKDGSFPSDMELVASDSIQNPVTLDATNEWKHVWTGLPNGSNDAETSYYYYVREESYTVNSTTYTWQADGTYKNGDVEGEYKQGYLNNGANSDDTEITVTNNHGMTVKKVWQDANGNLINGGSAQFKIYESGTGIYVKNQAGGDSFVLDEANNWTLQLSNLDLDPNKSYVIEELAIDHYELVNSETNLKFKGNENKTITLINRSTDEVETTELEVEKIWIPSVPDDVNEITVNLYKADNAQGENKKLVKSIELSKSTDWKGTFTELEKSESIYYFVEEVAVNGYTVSYTNNDGIRADATSEVIRITNIRRVAVSIEKAWTDDEAGLHDGDSVKVNLYRSTTPPATASDTDVADSDSAKVTYADISIPDDAEEVEDFELNKKNNWKATKEDLPYQNEKDMPYYYYIQELDDHGKPITNHDGCKTSNGKKYIPIRYENNGSDGTTGNIMLKVTNAPMPAATIGSMPSTGGTGTMPYTCAGLTLMGGAMAMAFRSISRRRKSA